MNIFWAEKQQQMPRCCSAGSREAIIHMELTPGTYELRGCAMPSWPTAQELHPANAYCFCSSSPRSIPLGHHRSWLWNKGCPLTSSEPLMSWRSVERGTRRELGQTRQDFHRCPQEGGQCLCWALNGLFGTESKDELPVTGFTYSSPHGFSLLRCKGEELRATAF